jgi:hypothetical protein
MFHSPNCQAALKHNRGFRAESGGNYDLALQAIKRFERLAGDAIETFAAEIFDKALNWWFSGLPEQTHRPMQCYPGAFAAVIN